jgi:sugar-specific transcriptional regulator TrmB
MYEYLLRACGLSKNESLVYLALLKIGKARTSQIVDSANISGGKIYETLNKLTDKGLVKEVIENNVKNFIANDPKMLINYLKEKEKELHNKETELRKVLPQLNSLKDNKQDLESVSLITSLKGVRPVVYTSLNNSKETIKIMGVRSSKDERFNNFWRSWHRDRSSSKKKALVLFSDKKTEYWDFFKNLNHTEVRSIIHFTPSAILIIDNEAFIFSYEDQLKCIHISSKSISSSFSTFFDDLWKISKR